MAEQYTILGGKVHVYKRPNSTYWQCATYLASNNRRTSTKDESLSKAKEIAEDWYLQLRGKIHSGEIKTEKTFKDASEQYLREYEVITQGERNKVYVEGQHSPLTTSTWCRSSATWASRKSPLAPCRSTGCNASKRPSRSAENRPPATRCIRKSSRCGRR